MEDQEIRIRLNKVRGESKKLAQLKQCFHYNTDCHKDIIHAHSITENGRLSLIEGIVNGNKVVYDLSEVIVPDEDSPFNLTLTLGKNKASTFTGFCRYHDQNLFSKIEGTNPYNKSSEHNFLHSYRSYAYYFHKSFAQTLAIFKEEESKHLDFLIAQRGIGFIDETMVEVENHVQVRNRLNTILKTKSFDDLNYFVFTKPGKFFVAASISIMPNFTFKGRKMFESHLEAVPMMLTAMPDEDESFVILAAFKEHEMGNVFIEELQKLPSTTVEKVISSLLIQNFGNTYIGPALWNAVGKGGRRNLFNEIADFRKRYMSERKSIKGFILNKFNFYHENFSGDRLGV